jgi:hypothetical protein
MKKLFLAFVLSLGLVTLLPSASFAAATGVTVIGGKITNKGSAVSGANVIISCNGTVKSTSSVGDGSYGVTYDAAACGPNDNASVHATKGGLGGSNSAGVNPSTFSSQVNIAMVDVSVVPEFGFLTGAATIAVAGSAFMIVRRKHAGQNI